jgi:hypothetical protein
MMPAILHTTAAIEAGTAVFFADAFSHNHSLVFLIGAAMIGTGAFIHALAGAQLLVKGR